MAKTKRLQYTERFAVVGMGDDFSSPSVEVFKKEQKMGTEVSCPECFSSFQCADGQAVSTKSGDAGSICSIDEVRDAIGVTLVAGRQYRITIEEVY